MTAPFGIGLGRVEVRKYREDQARGDDGRWIDEPDVAQAAREWAGLLDVDKPMGDVEGAHREMRAALRDPDDKSGWRPYASALLRAAATAPETTFPLYRGIRLYREEYEQAKALTPGSLLPMNLSSWTDDPDQTAHFTRQRSWDAEEQLPLVFVLEPGARALDMKDYVIDLLQHEREFLSSGRYEVLSVAEADGGLRVGLRQREAFDRPAQTVGTKGALLKYSPDQPRVPAGSPEGGQFASIDENSDELRLPFGLGRTSEPKEPVDPGDDTAWRSNLSAAFLAGGSVQDQYEDEQWANAKLVREELKSAFERAHPGTSVTFVDDYAMYGPGAEATIRALDRFDALLREFPPGIVSEIRFDEFFILGEMSGVLGSTTRDTRVITIDAQKHAAFGGIIERESGSGWYPPGTANIAGTVTHEFAHALASFIEQGEPDKKAVIDALGSGDYMVWGYPQSENSVVESCATNFQAAYTPGSAVADDPMWREWRERLDALLPKVTKVFDPNQPRDERGRWADGGGATVESAAARWSGVRGAQAIREELRAGSSADGAVLLRAIRDAEPTAPTLYRGIRLPSRAAVTEQFGKESSGFEETPHPQKWYQWLNSRGEVLRTRGYATVGVAKPEYADRMEERFRRIDPIWMAPVDEAGKWLRSTVEPHEVALNLSGWSSREQVADRFAERQGVGSVPVVLELSAGARALDISSQSFFQDLDGEDEWLTAGRFRVESVVPRAEGGYVVSLAQTGVFDGVADVGAAKSVALKYDPDQPRDENGRWTDGDGGALAIERWDATATGKPFPSLDGRTPINQNRLKYVMEKYDHWTPGERADINAATARYANAAEVRIRVPSDLLYRILDEGVQNQFATGNSGGMLDPDYRADVEGKLWFGLSNKAVESVEPGDRPIYGYLAHPSDPPWSGISQYGDAVLVLKDDVKDRTTFIIGDSLGNDSAAVPMRLAGDYGWLTGATPSRAAIPRYASDGSDYVEAHIFGGVTARDIDRIILTQGEQRFLEEATEYHIKQNDIPFVRTGKYVPAPGGDENSSSGQQVEGTEFPKDRK